MLLSRRAVTRMSEALNITRGISSHPRRLVPGSMDANNALAPAGGCIVFVNIMAATATAHATGPASQNQDSA
ncbi:hypothetical protein I7I50_00540 [Histoplasma capsulatum G186AR]|nr:hypothetical protein I7I52_07808 [Histoplasma capsulatum]QSS72628.1 hypothetical protein I7I50_00540 [Histoplasma capsulatum G186AR]